MNVGTWNVRAWKRLMPGGALSGLPTIRPFLAGSAAVGLALLGQVSLGRGATWSALALFAAALLVWVWVRVGSNRQAEEHRTPWFGKPVYAPERGLVLALSPWLRAVGLGMGGVLAVAAVGLAVWNWRVLDVSQATDGDWLRYGIAVLLFVAGAVVVEVTRPTQTRQAQTQAGYFLSRRATLGVLAVIVLLGAGLRLWNLDGMPFGTWYDEAANGLEAIRILREPAYRPIYTDGVNATGHYLFLIVAAFQLLETNTHAVRLISALMGIATILAAYYFGKELHSPMLGLFLAFLVAVARWSITFSRLGMYNSATPLFEFVVLAFLLRGLRRGSALDFTLAGVALGLGLCYYSAFQLFLPVVGIGGLWLAWRERARWDRLWTGAALMLVAALLVIAPVVKYAWEKPDSYFARVQKTSLFAGKEPEERLPALWTNTRKHLLMFNVRGDGNGRHNLPGAPMLDWVTGGLFVLGLGMCVVRLRDPAAALGPLWIATGLLGGILSLDFEAPQSLRAIGAQPAVLLVAAWPLVELDRLWRLGAGRYAPAVGAGIIAVALLAPMTIANVTTYFQRQANSFSSWNVHSTSETVAAQRLLAAEPGTTVYMVSLFDGHPTVRFLARDAVYRRLETNATLPIVAEIPGDLLLLLDIERRKLFEMAQRLYPDATFEEVRAPFGGPPTLLVAHIPAAQLRGLQGLQVAYTGGSENGAQIWDVPRASGQEDGALDLLWPEDAPVALPFTATWSGVLATATYGRYQFFVEAPREAELRIGEAVVVQGDASTGLAAELLLARGLHNIRLRAEGGEGRVRLAWQPPDGPPATIPGWALYHDPVRAQGLLGRYYPNGEWAGEPALLQIDPELGLYFHVPTLPRPYTVVWEGKLAAPAAGRYGFALRSIDESSLFINGAAVAASSGANEFGRGFVDLSVGLHDIEVRFADRTNHTNINLMWLPPGSAGPESYRIVPAEFLFPPQADYAAVNVEDLSRFLLPPATTPNRLVDDLLDAATVTVVLEGLAGPRGVAVIGDQVFVAETTGGRVLVVDAAATRGTPKQLDGVGLNLVEPFDLDVYPDGRLVVLDAGAGAILLVDPASGRVDVVPAPREIAERSRGLAIALDGSIWVANTPGRRVVVLEADGTIRREISLPPQGDSSMAFQPVDVLPLPDNTLLVTDVGAHRLLRFSLAGYLIQASPIPVANSMDGPHLATNRARDRVYLSQPETGRVVMLDAAGNPLAAWAARGDGTPRAKPVGLAAAEDGALWIADPEGGRLLKLIPTEQR